VQGVGEAGDELVLRPVSGFESAVQADAAQLTDGWSETTPALRAPSPVLGRDALSGWVG
jgi:hypothetical protein